METAVLPLKAHQFPDGPITGNPGGRRADGHDAAQIETDLGQRFRRPAGEQPGQLRPWHDGQNFRRAGGHDDFVVGVDVPHFSAGAGHDQRAGVDANRFLAVGGVQDDDLFALGFSFGSGRLPRFTRTDDHDVTKEVARGHGGHGAILGGQGRVFLRVMQLHDGARFSGCLAGAHVADAIDGGQAVGAVAAQAKAAAAGGLNPGAQQGDEQRVTGFEGIRPSIYDESHRGVPSWWNGLTSWRECYHFWWAGAMVF